MTQSTMNCRQVMLSLAVAAGGTLMPKVSFAGELAKLNIGTIEVSTFSDGTFDIPPRGFPMLHQRSCLQPVIRLSLM